MLVQQDMGGPSAGYPDLTDGGGGLDQMSPADVGAFLAVTASLDALPSSPPKALPVGVAAAPSGSAPDAVGTSGLRASSDLAGPSLPRHGTLELSMAREAGLPRPASQGSVPYRSLNVPGSRPYSSGRYASAVPVSFMERQQNGSNGQLTQLTQHAQQLQQAQKQQQQQRQQHPAAAHLPQGAIFQAPPGAPVASDDAPSLPAPAQVRHRCLPRYPL